MKNLYNRKLLSLPIMMADKKKKKLKEEERNCFICFHLPLCFSFVCLLFCLSSYWVLFFLLVSSFILLLHTNYLYYRLRVIQSQFRFMQSTTVHTGCMSACFRPQHPKECSLKWWHFLCTALGSALSLCLFDEDSRRNRPKSSTDRTPTEKWKMTVTF